MESNSWDAIGIYSGIYSYDKKNLSVKEIDSDKRVYGLETELNYWLTTNLQIGGSGHVVRTEEKDSSGNWVKSAVTGASASKASAWLGWYDEQYALRLQSNTMFDLSDDSDNEEKLTYIIIENTLKELTLYLKIKSLLP